MNTQARLVSTASTRARVVGAVKTIARAVTALPNPLLVLEGGGYLLLESGGYLLLEGEESNGVTWASLTEAWSTYSGVTWADWT